MQIVTTFDPTATTSGQFDMTVLNGGHLLMMNESSANIIINFGNGATSYVPANDKRLYNISQQMAQPHTVVKWTQQSTLPNPNSINQLVVESYDPGEIIAESYPTPFIRNTSVTGLITADELAGSIAPPPPVLPFIRLNRTDLPSPIFGVDNTATLSIGSSNDTLTGTIQVIAANGNQTLIQGDVITTDKVNFTSGSITRISQFGLYTVGTTLTAFNHNLGDVPDVILCQINGQTTTATFVKVDYTSLTSTQFSAIGEVANTSFKGIAIKF